MRSRGGQDAAADMAEPDTPIDVTTNGQLWRTTWHPPTVAPPGTAHGSTALCFAADRIVLVSDDGRLWQLPGGRPEAAEDWAATLRREVREEACATVVDWRLPGFSRGACLRGPEAGVVLVRALWRAEVRLDPWRPEQEMVQRTVVAAEAAWDMLTVPADAQPFYRRVFREAGLQA